MIKKKHKILIGIIALLFIILIAIPIIAKNYINSNGKELIGRKVHLESLSLNYFTGVLSLGEFTIYENDDKSTFLYINKLSVNPNVIACIGQNYVIEDVSIDGLKCNTILTDTIFNFNSIISHFDTEEEVEEKDTTAVHYAVEKIALTNSNLSYYDKNLESKVVLSNFNTYLSNGIAWNNPNLNILSDFNFTTGGKVDSKFNFNLENGLYDLDLKSEEINLSILFPYLKEMMIAKGLEGELNTNLFLKGNTNESSNLDIIGTFGVNNIVITDTFNRKVMALGLMKIVADSVNPAKDVYSLKTVELDKPYALFELYPETDNFSQLFKTTDSTSTVVEEESESNVFVMIKDYVVETLEGIKASNFSIDNVAITNAEVLYKDHTLIHPFDYTVSKANLTAHNVKSNADSLKVKFTALLNHKGELIANGILHPQKPEDVTLDMTIDKLEMKDLSSYFHHYVAFPVTKGRYSMRSDLKVVDKKLVSNHQLLLEKFKLGKKQKHEDAYKVPLKMGVAMLKNRKGDIEIEMPVEGDLADPKYKVWKVVGKIFTEMLVKAATSPYKLVAGGSDEESTTKIKINTLVAPLSSNNFSTLDKLANVLLEKPELELLIEPYYNLTNESEKMALTKAKAKYLKIVSIDSLTAEDILKIDALNKDDSLFNNYISSFIALGMRHLPIEQKVAGMYTQEVLKQQVEKAVLIKQKKIYNYLISKSVPSKQIVSITKVSEVPNNMSSIKNVQFHLLFDIVDDETESN
jgi:hypothetical protein